MATKAVAAAELAAESVAARAAAAAAAETATEAAARAGAARAAAAALAATAMATVARAGAARAAMSAADYAVSVPVSEVAMSDTGASTAFAAYVSDVYDCRPGWVRNDTAAGNLDAHFILGLVGLTSQYNDSEKNTLDDIKKKMTEAADLADMLGVQSDHVI
jgi:hypothetical protein